MLGVSSQDLCLPWDIMGREGSPGPLEGPLLLDLLCLTWKYQAVMTTIRVRCLYMFLKCFHTDPLRWNRYPWHFMGRRSDTER